MFNDEHRHTSLIATLREQWGLGEAFTGRDAAARTFSHAFTLDTPRDPATWPAPDTRPVPQYIQDALALGQTLSTLGKAVFNGIRAYAQQNGIQIEGLPADPNAPIPPRAGTAHHPQLPGDPIPPATPRRFRSGRLTLTLHVIGVPWQLPGNQHP